MRASEQIITVLGGASNPAAGMPPAPPGYHWAFVTYNGQQVTSNGVNVVALAPN